MSQLLIARPLTPSSSGGSGLFANCSPFPEPQGKGGCLILFFRAFFFPMIFTTKIFTCYIPGTRYDRFPSKSPPRPFKTRTAVKWSLCGVGTRQPPVPVLLQRQPSQTTPHTATPASPICAKRFRRQYSGQPALLLVLSRHYRATATVSIYTLE